MSRHDALQKLRRALSKEFDKYMCHGGDTVGIFMICGFFLEQILAETPEPLRSEMTATIYRRLCLNEHDDDDPHIVH